jgi:aldose sugar dehydrogenase
MIVLMKKIAVLTFAVVTLPARSGSAQGVDPRPANGADQRPAFAGQTDAPERKLNVDFTVETVADNINTGWSVAFLPNGKMLVTQRGGQLLLLGPGGARAEVSGLPPVDARGQGGLLDVALDPDFTTDPWVYFSYSESGAGGVAGTAVARGRFAGTRLDDVQVIFRQLPKVAGSGHYGSRLAFRADGTLFVTLGERQLGAPAQDPTSHLGKVVRIRRDGGVPADNPSFGAGARPELWSIGHRNPQGAAIHPQSGALWISEHGPQGGDELNVVRPGGNYGWPLRSHGCEYGAPVGSACRIGGGTHAPQFVEPVVVWEPLSTAPSGLLFYTGAGFAEWRGQAFVGALVGTTLWRIVLDGERAIARSEVAEVKALGERIRLAVQTPDGWIELLTDSGRLLRWQR